MSQTCIVAGLGNPGTEYSRTRHNIGFMVVDALGEFLNTDIRKKKFGGRFAQTVANDKKLILFKPWEYMNNSGKAVATVAGFYRIDLQNLLIVSDDINLESGVIRLRRGGSAGGHNGLADIIERLGTKEFARLRVGIGRAGAGDTVDYVLGEIDSEQKDAVLKGIEKAKSAVLCWLDKGIEAAMNEYNGGDNDS